MTRDRDHARRPGRSVLACLAALCLLAGCAAPPPAEPVQPMGAEELKRFSDAEAQLASPDAAIREVMHTVGRPIVISSFTLAIGFLALLMSGFATLREFGSLVAVTMTICLATDLSLLPALLARARA